MSSAEQQLVRAAARINAKMLQTRTYLQQERMLYTLQTAVNTPNPAPPGRPGFSVRSRQPNYQHSVLSQLQTIDSNASAASVATAATDPLASTPPPPPPAADVINSGGYSARFLHPNLVVAPLHLDRRPPPPSPPVRAPTNHTATTATTAAAAIKTAASVTAPNTTATATATATTTATAAPTTDSAASAAAATGGTGTAAPSPQPSPSPSPPLPQSSPPAIGSSPSPVPPDLVGGAPKRSATAATATATPTKKRPLMLSELDDSFKTDLDVNAPRPMRAAAALALSEVLNRSNTSSAGPTNTVSAAAAGGAAGGDGAAGMTDAAAAEASSEWWEQKKRRRWEADLGSVLESELTALAATVSPFDLMSIGGGAYGLPRLKSDVCLFSWRRSNIYGLDLLTIPAPNWLSDSTINFCFDYFQYEKFSSDQQQYLCFVPATAAFMIASTNDLDDISDAVHGCGMTAAEIRLVFIPINNNSNAMAMGGHHWALLVFDLNEQKFFYFDSAGQMNYAAAHSLACKLCPFLLPTHYPLTDQIKHANKYQFKLSAKHIAVAATPQQNNSYDCGVYTIAIAEQIATQAVALWSSSSLNAKTSTTNKPSDGDAKSGGGGGGGGGSVDSKSAAGSGGSGGAACVSSVVTDPAQQKLLFSALTTDAMNEKRAQIAQYIKAIDAKCKALAAATKK